MLRQTWLFVVQRLSLEFCADVGLEVVQLDLVQVLLPRLQTRSDALWRDQASDLPVYESLCARRAGLCGPESGVDDP